jgi:hypothetical protein
MKQVCASSLTAWLRLQLLKCTCDLCAMMQLQHGTVSFEGRSIYEWSSKVCVRIHAHTTIYYHFSAIRGISCVLVCYALH